MHTYMYLHPSEDMETYHSKLFTASLAQIQHAGKCAEKNRESALKPMYSSLTVKPLCGGLSKLGSQL